MCFITASTSFGVINTTYLFNCFRLLRYCMGDRVGQWCWGNFQCRDLLTGIVVGGGEGRAAGQAALAVGTGLGVCFYYNLSGLSS